jgi:hypothetical protein
MEIAPLVRLKDQKRILSRMMIDSVNRGNRNFHSRNHVHNQAEKLYDGCIGEANFDPLG